MDIVDEILAAENPALGRAIRAIIGGDAAALRVELKTAPDLVHARSGSIHRATLLHYVAANGIEDALQRAVPNADEGRPSFDPLAGHECLFGAFEFSCGKPVDHVEDPSPQLRCYGRISRFGRSPALLRARKRSSPTERGVDRLANLIDRSPLPRTQGRKRLPQPFLVI